MLMAGAGLRLGELRKQWVITYSRASPSKPANCFIVPFPTIWIILNLWSVGLWHFVLRLHYNERCFNIFVLCGYFKQNELLVYALLMHRDDLFQQTSFPYSSHVLFNEMENMLTKFAVH